MKWLEKKLHKDAVCCFKQIQKAVPKNISSMATYLQSQKPSK